MNRIVITWLAVVLCALNFPAYANMNEMERSVEAGAAIDPVNGVVTAQANRHRRERAHTHAPTRRQAPVVVIVPGRNYHWSRHMQRQQEDMVRATRGTRIKVTRTKDNRLRLAIPADVSFDTGRYDIKPNMRPILNRFAATLRNHPATQIAVVGHTDNTGSDEINDPLSINRAASTRDYLADRGVSERRIAIDGRGSYEPISTNNTAAGRAMNRRVDIYVWELVP
ncbi:MAG: OmpA family protein [Betaproteobacteria bacterium]|nr:OmpA family protein [Betaproteobacteria bacterium]